MSQFASVELAGGVPFVSDQDLDDALVEAGVPDRTAHAVLDTNESARIDGLRLSLTVPAAIAVVAMFLTRLLPRRPAGA